MSTPANMTTLQVHQRTSLLQILSPPFPFSSSPNPTTTIIITDRPWHLFLVD
ncbi:predicted protein [Botrytis cinerea T4]|uniref:Uncharacterized protein n=1 Tax=Botryotinia fuckeliana (strain T4) TaxID=999810 RepID=G2YG13_BOTF4|nr:predicted protein [Botrytis cinerea T4]